MTDTGILLDPCRYLDSAFLPVFPGESIPPPNISHLPASTAPTPAPRPLDTKILLHAEVSDPKIPPRSGHDGRLALFPLPRLFFLLFGLLHLLLQPVYPLSLGLRRTQRGPVSLVLNHIGMGDTVLCGEKIPGKHFPGVGAREMARFGGGVEDLSSGGWMYGKNIDRLVPDLSGIWCGQRGLGEHAKDGASVGFCEGLVLRRRESPLVARSQRGTETFDAREDLWPG